MQDITVSDSKSITNNSLSTRLNQEIKLYDSNHKYNTIFVTSSNINYKPRSKSINNYSENNTNSQVDSASNKKSYPIIICTEANKTSIYRLRQTTTLQKQNLGNVLVDTDLSSYTNSTCSRYRKYDTSDLEWKDSHISENSIIDSTNDKSIKNNYKTRIKNTSIIAKFKQIPISVPKNQIIIISK